MSNRALTYGAGLVAVAGGYYLYQAGGSPKAAEKRFEHDVTKAASSVRGELPGKTDELKSGAKVYAADAGKKIDDLTHDAKRGIANADAKLEQYRASAEKNIDAALKETRKEVNAAVDSFDKNVSQAKSSVSGWFGSSNSNDQNERTHPGWGPVQESVLESPRVSPRSSTPYSFAWPDAVDRLARYTIEINLDSPSSQPTIVAEKKESLSLCEIDERCARLESLHKQKIRRELENPGHRKPYSITADELDEYLDDDMSMDPSVAKLTVAMRMMRSALKQYQQVDLEMEKSAKPSYLPQIRLMEDHTELTSILRCIESIINKDMIAKEETKDCGFNNLNNAGEIQPCSLGGTCW
ncbi:hypothetical protein AMS68_000146 [Peltaster fructicola]|uniref:Uncharacterized protein n=1 Tax=Peltaster fructicola TaxID=286661 RepID=A0A6H0XJ17_9PEZI|nr:hypothetical protein AMS68_000146 [Peltaster fructicola]